MHTSLALAVSLIFALVVTVEALKCNATNPCPSSAPCCSDFGFCGSEHFCLGGCNPIASNSLDSCRPNPICKSATHTFTDNSRILSNATFFDGNATEYDWVVDKGNIMNTNTSGGELALLLTKENGGTRISSTRYLHYGTVTARLKAGRWGGIVVAAITMSDIKDEIDWEFPGNSTGQVQTNYFWQGVIPTPRDGGISEVQDTFGTYHDYTLDWQPKTLTFSIDGKVVRTVNASNTVDPQGVTRFPSTPSRVQLSIWPAGIEGVAAGTVHWSGGLINWDDPDYKSAGHFYTLVKSVSIKCGDPETPGPNITSYKYGKNSTLMMPDVLLSNQTTLLNEARAAFKYNGLQFQGMLLAVGALLFGSYVL